MSFLNWHRNTVDARNSSSKPKYWLDLEERVEDVVGVRKEGVSETTQRRCIVFDLVDDASAGGHR